MSSTQSILELNQQRYLEESEEALLLMSDLYFYKKKFLLGCGVDRDKMNFYMQQHRFLCTDICEVIEFIQCKIDGKLEEDTIKKAKKSTYLMDLIHKYAKDNCCTQEEAEDACSRVCWNDGEDVPW